MNTLKFNHRRHLSSRSADYQFLLRWNQTTPSAAIVHGHVTCMLKKEPWLTSSGKNGSGNTSGERGEISNVRQPKTRKRLQRTAAAKNLSVSSRSQVNRNHIWATFWFYCQNPTSWDVLSQYLAGDVKFKLKNLINHDPCTTRTCWHIIVICEHVSCRQRDAFASICILYTHKQVLSLAQCLPPASMLRRHLAVLGPSHKQTLVCQTRLLRGRPPHIRIRIRAPSMMPKPLVI